MHPYRARRAALLQSGSRDTALIQSARGVRVASKRRSGPIDRGEPQADSAVDIALEIFDFGLALFDLVEEQVANRYHVDHHALGHNG